jgi:ketosteroid isomerase-like protein
MKKSLILMAFAGIMASCNNKPAEPTTEVAEVVPDATTITYPYTATYSSDFKMGDPALAKVVLDMYKAVEDNKMDSLGQYYADSVVRYNFSQKLMTLSRDEMVNLAKTFRAQFKEFSETPVAFTSLHSNDKNEDWVITWIKERVTYQSGKKDSTTYQENWRFKDGKIYMVDSYAKFAK